MNRTNRRRQATLSDAPVGRWILPREAPPRPPMTVHPTHPQTARRPEPPATLERIVVFGNPLKAGLEPVLADLAAWARRSHVALTLAEDIAPLLQAGGDPAFGSFSPADVEARHFPCGEPTLVLCLGGDGTLLHAVRRFWPLRAPVLAVNMGTLSFNAAVDPAGLTAMLDAWETRPPRLSERMVLRVRLCRAGETHEAVALNDVVVAKTGDTRLVHLSLRQDGELISHYAADGVIVATPTGSTAYNLSAGGPILVPTMRALIVTAICPHTISSRPVVLPPEPALAIEMRPHHARNLAMIWVDGQEQWQLEPGDRLEIGAEPEPLRLIVGPDYEYFGRLRGGFHWSGDLTAHVAEDAHGRNQDVHQ